METGKDSHAITASTVELATFYVGESLYGMDILKVQEINKLMDMTRVPQAPDYVMGILNLRGQIVTVIDLGNKLNLDNIQVNETSRNIIVNSGNEYIGLCIVFRTLYHSSGCIQRLVKCLGYRITRFIPVLFLPV